MNMNARSHTCPYHESTEIDDFDMLDERARANPWPYYDWLRSEDERQVYQLTLDKSFYLIHRHKDVKKAFLASEELASGILPSSEQLFIALMDGDQHRQLRSAIAPIFLPKYIDELSVGISSIVATQTNHLKTQLAVDIIQEWAIPIVMKSLAQFMGMPSDDNSVHTYYSHSLAINKAIFVTGGTGPRRSSTPTWREKARISWSMMKNLPKIIQLWRALGSSGMRSLVTKFRMSGQKLTVPRPNFDKIPQAIAPFLDLLILFGKQLKDATASESEAVEHLKRSITKNESSLLEMTLASAFILFAGHETTISLLSNMLVHLAHHPKQLAELKQSPAKSELFIEECLRYYTPVGRFLRRVKIPVSINNNTIPAGAIVILMTGAANTDDEKFEQACQFNIDRSNNSQHLSFGKGTHYCLGAYFARLIAQSSLSEIIKQVNSISVDDSQQSILVTDRDNGVFRYEKIYLHVS